MSAHPKRGALSRLVLAACRREGCTARDIAERTGLRVVDVSRALHHLREQGAIDSERSAAHSGAHIWRKTRGKRDKPNIDPRATMAPLREGPRTTPDLHAELRCRRTLEGTRCQLRTCERLGWVTSEPFDGVVVWWLTPAGARAVQAWDLDMEHARQVARAKP